MTTGRNTEQTGNALGVVKTQEVQLSLPDTGLQLEKGGTLRELTVAYEVYGKPSPGNDNSVFLCHALTGDAHAAGLHGMEGEKPGWWDEMIGPGKGIDTNHYQVICANILGGCRGTTGPGSINPDSGHPYGAAFPTITVSDIIGVHRRLLDHLGVTRLAAVIGGSFGGMQVLEWAVRHPEQAARYICIASAAQLSTQALAFDVVGRKAITSDPDWQQGDYYETERRPIRGLAHARKIGHITYLSPEIMDRRFGRERRELETPAERFGTNFQIESYLDHQGRKFVDRFDANSYLHITGAMDDFDLAERHGSLEEALSKTEGKFLIVALSSDWLFPPEQSIEIARALVQTGKPISYCLLQAPHGHDAFLVEIEHLSEAIRAFLPWIDSGTTTAPSRSRATRGTPDSALAPAIEREYDLIAAMVKPGARVLDLGCGDGALLSRIKARKQTAGMGVDIDIQQVISVLDRGHDILQTDLDSGLAMIPDASYDIAILSETLQVARRPRFVLRELLRVAKTGIVSFPNFGHLSHRTSLGFRGRMPKSHAIPFEWYDTPNIHLFTLKDFLELCLEDGIQVLGVLCLPGPSLWDRLMVDLGICNLGAERVVVRLARSEGQPTRWTCRPFGRYRKAKDLS